MGHAKKLILRLLCVIRKYKAEKCATKQTSGKNLHIWRGGIEAKWRVTKNGFTEGLLREMKLLQRGGFNL
jgi:hypothetical protein